MLNPETVKPRRIEAEYMTPPPRRCFSKAEVKKKKTSSIATELALRLNVQNRIFFYYYYFEIAL